MNLQHDAVAKKFDIAAVVISSGVTIFELIIGNGIFCQATGAALFLVTKVGTPLYLEEPFKASGTGLAWYRIFVTMATICYLITVLVENKEYLQNFLLDTVWGSIQKLCKSTSKVNQDPEQGEELQSISTAEASESQNTDWDRSVSSPANSNHADPQKEEGLPEIIQVAAYQPPASQSVIEEVESQPQRLPSRLSYPAAQLTLLERQDTKYLVSCLEKTRVQQDNVSQLDQLCPRLARHSESGTVVFLTQDKIFQNGFNLNEKQLNGNREQLHGNGEQQDGSGKQIHGNTAPPHGNGEKPNGNAEQPYGNEGQTHWNAGQPHGNAEQPHRIGEQLNGYAEQPNENSEEPHGNGKQPGESSQESLWKSSFLIAILAFSLCFIFTILDMQNGLAIAVVERLLRLNYYCMPFYWVILVDECFFVSKRILRTWLADYFSIYFD